MMAGFPFPYVCDGWFTSMSNQFFVTELIIDFLIYILFWLLLIFSINRFFVKITISSKDGKTKFTKILDTRPEMSQIHYCNDLYTVVGFPCGGPCYSRVFVFTDKSRAVEQYDYPQEVKNSINIIGHIKDEKFENLIIHNFLNSKELVVHLPDSNPWNYGQMDSMSVKNDKLILYYQSKSSKSIAKSVNLKSIL